MRRLAILMSAAALGGCSLEPAYVRPAPAIPGAWPVGAAYPVATAAAVPTAVDYRDIFRDARLQGLIARAITGNQDLQAALANVEIARAQYRGQRAEQLPHIDVTASANQSHEAARADADRRTRSFDAEVGLNAFELDLFGRLRSLSHAALQQYLATEAGARAARLTLTQSVADAWLTLAADRSLLTIANETEAASERTVALTQARLSGGIAPRTDLDQAQTLLQQARSDQASLTTQVAQDRNALELLVGGSVSESELAPGIEDLGAALGEAPAGLDSHILLARPDVAAAEHRLQAANAQIGAARAAFFPSLSLTALAGVASPALSALFAGGSTVWQAGATAAVPLFDGGANKAGLSQAKGERDLAVAQYQGAIQTAFREVADALARRGTIKTQLAAQIALVAAAQQAYDLSVARYKEGIDPYLATLDAQRTLYAAQRTLTATRLDEAQNLAALYASIGAPPA